MFAIDWQVAAAIATVISTVAFIASAIVVVLQLRQAARERYFSITAHLFEIWQSPDFQHDQLYLLHMLSCATWDEFCRLGRGERAERAIHRVGGYYDRVGNLVRHNLINKQDILPTIGGYAVAVWHRIEPLVKELRLRENAVLFQNYESLLPDCHECYVPGIAPLKAPSAAASANPPAQDYVIEDPAASESFFGGDNASVLQAGDATNGKTMESTVEMANHAGRAQVAPDLTLPDSDGIAHALSEFTASGPAVVVYARGAWCPFCLRQLSDYAERYADFKRSGVEVVALSPESPRKARRMRTGLKLPFTVLSDTHYVAAHTFGLMGHEKPGMPTPATLVLDAQRSVRLSTLNQAEKSLFAPDVLDYARALKQLDTNGAVSGAIASIPIPEVRKPKAGVLWGRALANMAIGLISR
jgi:peroxiredoxin